MSIRPDHGTARQPAASTPPAHDSRPLAHDLSPSTAPQMEPCTACGEVGYPARYHTFLDCLRAKRRGPEGLSENDIDSLFQYAAAGEAILLHGREALREASAIQEQRRRDQNARAERSARKQDQLDG